MHDEPASCCSDVKVVTSGTHRVRALEATWAALQPRLADVGITRIANVTGLDDIGIPVVMVCRPNSRTLSVFQGKGVTFDAARVSGVMEAVECLHAEEVDAVVRVGPPAALSARGATADVAALPLRRGRRFDATRPLRWVEGHDLLQDDACWVPYECVCIGDEVDQQFMSSSNGLAAGNSWTEALSHAICELAERHALAVWQELPGALRRATRVDLATIDDAACAWMLERFADAEVAAAVWNMTCELGIPAFACYIAQDPGHGGRMVQPAAGFGCHPDRDIAIGRALSEAAQSRLTHIAGARDDMMPCEYSEGQRPSFVRRIREFIDGGGGHDARGIAGRTAASVGDDVEWELSQLEAAGIRQLVAMDLTRPALGIPAVRVVAPGLRMPGCTSARRWSRAA